MAKDTTEGILPTTGSICSIPLETPVAYGVHAALPVTAIEYGFTNEDGVTETSDVSQTNILTWQGSQIFRKITTESSLEFTFTLLQTNEEILELIVGRAKNAITGAYHVDPAITRPHLQWIIDAVDEGMNKKVRYYIPDGQVTTVGERTINAQGIWAQEITLTTFPKEIAGETGSYLLFTGTAVEEEEPEDEETPVVEG